MYVSISERIPFCSWPAPVETELLVYVCTLVSWFHCFDVLPTHYTLWMIWKGEIMLWFMCRCMTRDPYIYLLSFFFYFNPSSWLRLCVRVCPVSPSRARFLTDNKNCAEGRSSWSRADTLSMSRFSWGRRHRRYGCLKRVFVHSFDFKCVSSDAGPLSVPAHLSHNNLKSMRHWAQHLKSID